MPRPCGEEQVSLQDARGRVLSRDVVLYPKIRLIKELQQRLPLAELSPVEQMQL